MELFMESVAETQMMSLLSANSGHSIVKFDRLK